MRCRPTIPIPMPPRAKQRCGFETWPIVPLTADSAMPMPMPPMACSSRKGGNPVTCVRPTKAAVVIQKPAGASRRGFTRWNRGAITRLVSTAMPRKTVASPPA